MNSYAKGSRVKRKAKEYLTSLGYFVADVEKVGKFGPTDAFGAFDLLAVNKSEWVLVQVTCNRPHGHQKYHDFSCKYGSLDRKVLQLVWVDRVGWKVFWY